MGAVAGVYFRIINQFNAAAFDNYKPYRLQNASMEIIQVLIKDAIVTGLENKSVFNQISVGPNPSKSSVSFSQTLTSIKLHDMIGNVVQTATSAESMDISTLTRGIYLLTASELAHPIKIVKE